MRVCLQEFVVPVVISNGTATHADINVSLWFTSGFLATREPISLSIGEGRRERVRLTLGVMKGRGVFPVTVRASASDLLLVLWRRLPADAPSLTVEGDRRILDRWLRLGMP